MAIIGIYKITSPTGRVYIGQSKDIEYRKYQYSVLQCRDQWKIYRSIRNHGFESHEFDILIEFDLENFSQKMLNAAEWSLYLSYKIAGYEMMNVQEPHLKVRGGSKTIVQEAEEIVNKGFNYDKLFKDINKLKMNILFLESQLN